MPKVSIIIPAYNAMAYLPETLESVLNQTFTDLEVLIINDGSPDGIVEWASEIKDSRVKLISQENQGLSGARNTGIWPSQGEYLAFLDADDIWEAKKLEKQVEYLEKHPDVGLVSSWISNVDRNGNFIDIYDCSEGGKDLTKALFCSNILYCGSNPLVRRICFEKVGVPAEKLHILGVVPLLPATVNPDEFRQQHNLVDVPVILFVGRRSAYKGIKALLSAAHQVWQTIPNAHFVFVGPDTPESLEWFENADSRIHYLGKVSDQEKGDAIAACDIFCMPSLFEILPTVYLEAWSYSKPVIGGKAQGVPELIEGNNAGFAVEQTPEAISAAITKLLQDPALSQNLGDNGNVLVNQNYSLSAVVSKSESLYQKVIESPKP